MTCPQSYAEPRRRRRARGRRPGPRWRGWRARRGSAGWRSPSTYPRAVLAVFSNSWNVAGGGVVSAVAVGGGGSRAVASLDLLPRWVRVGGGRLRALPARDSGSPPRLEIGCPEFSLQCAGQQLWDAQEVYGGLGAEPITRVAPQVSWGCPPRLPRAVVRLLDDAALGDLRRLAGDRLGAKADTYFLRILDGRARLGGVEGRAEHPQPWRGFFSAAGDGGRVPQDAMGGN